MKFTQPCAFTDDNEDNNVQYCQIVLFVIRMSERKKGDEQIKGNVAKLDRDKSDGRKKEIEIEIKRKLSENKKVM